MVEWVSGVITPVLKTMVYLGIFGYIFFIVLRAVVRLHRKSWKWWFKYSIMKKSYSEKDIGWIVKYMEEGNNYWDMKKALLIHGTPQDRMYEILYIAMKINNEKGGVNYGRKPKRSIGENTSSIEYPKTSS